MQRVILLNMDAPQHTRMRSIISRGFTPRAVNNLQGRARRAGAATSSPRPARRTTGDFVRDVACELPLQAIAELLGVPQEDRLKIFDWSNRMVCYDDPDFDPRTAQVASFEMLSYFMEMAEERKENPADDIVTKLVTADIDGQELTSDEFGFFTILLSVAGNETTRNAISHGMIAFMENPDQWEIYKARAPGDDGRRDRPLVDAGGRRSSARRRRTPRSAARRSRPATASGMYYAAANFDPEVFDDPYKFDIMRDPNPHLGFGGTGAHYCIGANLARVEMNLIFNAIADTIPDISMIGDPKRLRSGWLNGIKELPVQYKCPVAH